jgi:hypothetical protein
MKQPRDMTARFLHRITWNRTSGGRSFCDKVVFLVVVFMLVVLSGFCSDKNVLVTAAPVGRKATNGQNTPSGGLPTKSYSGGVGFSKSCPEEDVGVKTYLAQTVFEGKARSKSPVQDGVYNVTFVVQQVYKGSEPGFLKSQVRLQFAEKKISSNSNFQKCNGEGNKNSVMKANIKRGGKYIVFVDKVEQHIFKARGEPVRRNEKTVKAVKDILCPNCGKFRHLCNSCDVIVANFSLSTLTVEGFVFCHILFIRNHGKKIRILQPEYIFKIFSILLCEITRKNSCFNPVHRTCVSVKIQNFSKSVSSKGAGLKKKCTYFLVYLCGSVSSLYALSHTREMLLFTFVMSVRLSTYISAAPTGRIFLWGLL